MTKVIAVESTAGFWHWMCSACGSGSRRWYPTRAEALRAGRCHAEEHEVNRLQMSLFWPDLV